MIRMPLMMLLDAVTGLPAVRFQERGFYEMLSVPAGGALIDRKMSCGSRGGGERFYFTSKNNLASRISGRSGSACRQFASNLVK